MTLSLETNFLPLLSVGGTRCECSEKESIDTKIFLPPQLWSLVPAPQREAYLSEKKKDTAPVLDLLPLGYAKVLGKGRIPNIPLVVRARYFSKEAERKIKDAGGVVELVA